MMSPVSNKLNKITKIFNSNCKISQYIIERLKKQLRGIKSIMYSDITNLIIR